jgi:hypothetical protein
MIGDSASTLDPTLSRGVFKAIMSGMIGSFSPVGDAYAE